MCWQRRLRGVLATVMAVAPVLVVRAADPFTTAAPMFKDRQWTPWKVAAGQSTPQSVAGVQKLVDPFPTPIEANGTGVSVDFVEFATIPKAGASGTEWPRMMLLVDEPGTKRMFVNTMQGMLYSVSYDGKTVSPYVDINDAKWGNPLETRGSERGFQSFAFHPQFTERGTAGYGKFYTWADTSNMTPAADANSTATVAVSPEVILSADAPALSSDNLITFEEVSKFYGEILGVNRVNLQISPGITSLVGPNGSGKTTLMNLMCGLLKPTSGQISVLGLSPHDPEPLFRKLGYCSQFDSFPNRATAREFIEFYLLVQGYTRQQTRDLAQQALERVSLTEAADRKVSAFSKGMRQRVRLAQSIAHNPSVLVLDEPLNGLDPLARAEIIRLFRQLAEAGMYVIISSHILHEVDMMSDSVVLLNNGYIVAEGEVHGVRDEIHERPIQILIRCDRPQVLAARLFEHEYTVEARIHDDRQGLFVKTRRPDDFYLLLNKVITEQHLEVESVAPVDDDLNAVYQYLITSDGAST